MTTGLDTQPSATTYDLEDLVEEAWRGNVRVPHFQRDFRWTRVDVIRLLDSIVKGYPIGSLLLWVRRAPAQTVTLGALAIDAPGTENALWVVDGQQRITSLSNALHSDGYRTQEFGIAYDLRSSQFVPAPNSDQDSLMVPLPTIFDLHNVLQWFAKRPEASEYLTNATRVTKRLRQYKVPAYLVKQRDESILVDIFDRMNNYGKRLSRAEIFSALFAGPEESASERLDIGLIAEHLSQTFGFGVIDDDTILRAVLARRGPDPGRDIRVEFNDQIRRGIVEFPGENRDDAYQAGEEALRKSVAFLQDIAGVPHLTLLSYRYFIVVLTRFFAHFPEPDPRNVRLLRRWYWRMAISGPEIFKASFTNAMRVLCSKIKPGDESGSVQRLLEPVDRLEQPLPDIRRLRTNEATGKIALCSMWHQQPRSPITGEPYSRQQLFESLIDRPTAADVISSLFSRWATPTSHTLWAGTKIFTPDNTESLEQVLMGLTAKPSNLRSGDWAKVLASHGMTKETSALLSTNQTVSFIERRQETLDINFRKFMQMMAEWGFEDTPPLDSLIVDDDDVID